MAQNIKFHTRQRYGQISYNKLLFLIKLNSLFNQHKELKINNQEKQSRETIYLKLSINTKGKAF